MVCFGVALIIFDDDFLCVAAGFPRIQLIWPILSVVVSDIT